MVCWPGRELGSGGANTLMQRRLCCSTPGAESPAGRRSAVPCRYRGYLENCQFAPKKFRDLGQREERLVLEMHTSLCASVSPSEGGNAASFLACGAGSE